jgi:trk system potassium uptake protein TrkA
LPTGATVLRPEHTLILVTRREKLGTVIAFLTSAPESQSTAADSVLASLRKIDFLEPLSDAELAELARGLDLVRRGPGEQLFRRGDPDSCFYLVLSGEVAMLGDDERSVIETIPKDGFFGEVSLLTGAPVASTAKALTECELVAIGRDDFRRLMMASPAVGVEMSRILGRRLAESGKKAPETRSRR